MEINNENIPPEQLYLEHHFTTPRVLPVLRLVFEATPDDFNAAPLHLLPPEETL